MKILITDMTQFGLALRAARRASRIRIDDAAALAGLSKQYVGDAEHGKPTLQMGLIFKLLSEMGVHMELDLPQAAVEEMQRLQARGAAAPAAKRPQRARPDRSQG